MTTNDKYSCKKVISNVLIFQWLYFYPFKITIILWISNDVIMVLKGFFTQLIQMDNSRKVLDLDGLVDVVV